MLVNAIVPSPTGTDPFREGKSKDLLDVLRGFSPCNRLSEPTEILETDCFLAKATCVS